MAEQTLFTGGTILSMNPAREVFHTHALLAERDTIRAILPEREAAGLFPHAQRVDCRGMCILPGFIDGGAMAGHVLLKGWAQSYPAWRQRALGRFFAQDATAGFWRIDGALLAAERLLAGSTTGAVYGGFGADFGAGSAACTAAAASYKQGYAGLGGRLLLGSRAAAENAPNSPDKPFLYLGPLLPAKQTQRPASDADFCGISEKERQALQDTLQYAGAAGIGVMAEVFGNDLTVLWALGLHTQDVHFIFLQAGGLSYREAQRIKKEGHSVVHIPIASPCYCPLAELLELGVPCALASSPSHTGLPADMLQTARRAQMLEQLRFDDMLYLPPHRQLELITIDAACALGLGDKLGSLEEGKLADITVINLQMPQTVPYHKTEVHRLLIDASARQVEHVFVGGKQVVKRRRLVYAGADLLQTAAAEAQRALAALPPAPASLAGCADSAGEEAAP